MVERRPPPDPRGQGSGPSHARRARRGPVLRSLALTAVLLLAASALASCDDSADSNQAGSAAATVAAPDPFSAPNGGREVSPVPGEELPPGPRRPRTPAGSTPGPDGSVPGGETSPKDPLDPPNPSGDPEFPTDTSKPPHCQLAAKVFNAFSRGGDQSAAATDVVRSGLLDQLVSAAPEDAAPLLAPMANDIKAIARGEPDAAPRFARSAEVYFTYTFRLCNVSLPR